MNPQIRMTRWINQTVVITTMTRRVMKSTTRRMNQKKKTLTTLKLNHTEGPLLWLRRKSSCLSQRFVENDRYRVGEVQAAHFRIEHGNGHTTLPVGVQQIF